MLESLSSSSSIQLAYLCNLAAATKILEPVQQQHICRLLGFTEAYNLIKFQPSNYSQMIFTEAPITEYERSRNEEIMKNNRELERLGIKTLVPIVNNTSVERKGEDNEVSGSQYTGQESEDCEDEEVISKVPILLVFLPNEALQVAGCNFFLVLCRPCRGAFCQKIPSGILSEQEAQRESPCHLLDKSKPLG